MATKKTVEIPPSSMTRIVSCPWSHRYDKRVEYNDNIDYDNILAGTTDTKVGTVAHRYASACLRKDEVERRKQERSNYFNPLMRDNVEKYISFVRDIAERENGVFWVEHDMVDGQLSFLYEGCEGRSDVVISGDYDLYVIDYKYGRERIEAENNFQLLAYAVGAEDELAELGYRHNAIHIIVYNGRDHHVSEWTLTRVQAKLWTDWMHKQIADALMQTEDAEVSAGKWCVSCQHKKECGCWYKWVTSNNLSGNVEMTTEDWQALACCVTDKLKDNNIKEIKKAVKEQIINDGVDGKEIKEEEYLPRTWTKSASDKLVMLMQRKGIAEDKYTKKTIMTPRQILRAFEGDTEIEQFIQKEIKKETRTKIKAN